MPTSARKSSLGTLRRIQQRAHLPFRADDLGRGKKTGLPVPIIEHKSDEFEPFDEILSQANARTAWHGQRNRPGSSKKRKSVALIQEDDDGDEMSMELDDYGGPINTNASVHFANGLPPSSSPLGPRRAGSSARPVASRADVDFDELPSPRPQKSLVSSMRRSSVGSALQSSYVPPDLHDDSLFDAGDDVEMDAEEMEESGVRSRSSNQQATTARRSRSESDDDDVPKAQSKGKARRETQDEDDIVEEEISRGLGDVEMEQDEDEEVAEPPPKKPPKEKRPRKKRALPVVPLSPENTTGVRRGKRLRYEPLEWWRSEKVVYGRRDPGKKTYVPTIKEIVRIPKDPPKPLGVAAHKGRRHHNRRSKSEVVVATDNPEEGWDEKTPTNGVVIDWFTGNEVSRRLAFPGRLVGHRPAANNDFFFTKVFGDGEYIAAGQLRIPPNKHKPSKMTKDNTYVFYVIEGAVTFKVHESSYVLCTGGMILVPRGNTYYIQNIAERDARLFFAQARRVSADEEAPPEVLPAMDAETTVTPQRRSNSTGQAPTTARFSSERAPPGKRAATATRA